MAGTAPVVLGFLLCLSRQRSPPMGDIIKGVFGIWLIFWVLIPFLNALGG